MKIVAVFLLLPGLTSAFLGPCASSRSSIALFGNKIGEDGGLGQRRQFLSYVAMTGISAVGIVPTGASAKEKLEYLTEPTEEFKASEAERAKFRQAQLVIKKDFDAAIVKLTTEEGKE